MDTTMDTQRTIQEIETKDKPGFVYTTGTRKVLADDDANDYTRCVGMAMIDDRVRFGFDAEIGRALASFYTLSFSHCHIHTVV